MRHFSTDFAFRNYLFVIYKWALCRFLWNLTSGGMKGNAEIERHTGAQRIGRQVLGFGNA